MASEHWLPALGGGSGQAAGSGGALHVAVSGSVTVQLPACSQSAVVRQLGRGSFPQLQ